MTRWVRNVASALAALTAAATLAACGAGGDPAPNFSTVTPSAPTTSASPSPTAKNTRPGESSPTPFAGATADTSEGALAFAAYYMQTLDWVFASGNVATLERFYSPQCKTCEERLRYLDGVFSDGQYVKGARIRIQRQALVSNDRRGGADFAVSTEVTAEAGAVVSSSGATASPIPAFSSYTLTTWLTQSSSGDWQIVDERSV